jgi:hypothetical protein
LGGSQLLRRPAQHIRRFWLFAKLCIEIRNPRIITAEDRDFPILIFKLKIGQRRRNGLLCLFLERRRIPTRIFNHNIQYHPAAIA